MPADLGAQASSIALRDSVIARELQRLVESGRHDAQRWPVLRDVLQDLRATYGTNGWKPLWSTSGIPTLSAKQVTQQLAQIDTRGLSSADYDAARLDALAASSSPHNQALVVEFDVMLTVATTRAVRSLQYGRVPATAAHAQLRFTHEPFDLQATLRTLASSSDAVAIFDGLEPPFLHYRLLKLALARYRVMNVDSSVRALRLRATLRAGERDPGIPVVRRTLITFGDLPMATAVSPGADSLRYDSTLVAAVERFQRRHGLTTDGALGVGTMAQLQRPIADRISQIQLTMERWRWLPHTISTPPPIIVNIPAFRLYAFTRNSDREADLISMDVVVGKAFDHKTPVFSSALRYLVFSPYWDVPPSIARKETIPLARRDPTYLARNEFEIVNNSDVLLGTSDAAVDAVAAGRARIRQRPGPKNALGVVKFIFPNAFNVYLHDTPAQAVFLRSRRDASHGCIRIAEPLRLASFLLRDQTAWDSTRMSEATHRATPLQVDLSQPVPVHMVYATAAARENGELDFYADIYGHDRTLARLLARGYPFP